MRQTGKLETLQGFHLTVNPFGFLETGTLGLWAMLVFSEWVCNLKRFILTTKFCDWKNNSENAILKIMQEFSCLELFTFECPQLPGVLIPTSSLQSALSIIGQCYRSMPSVINVKSTMGMGKIKNLKYFSCEVQYISLFASFI